MIGYEKTIARTAAGSRPTAELRPTEERIRQLQAEKAHLWRAGKQRRASGGGPKTKPVYRSDGQRFDSATKAGENVNHSGTYISRACRDKFAIHGLYYAYAPFEEAK